MRLQEMEIGDTVSRGNSYNIRRVNGYEWRYNSGNLVKPTSTVWEYTDYKLINKKEKEMKNDVNYIGGDYKLVAVTFELDNNKSKTPYIFKIDIDMLVQLDDLVVVEASTGLLIARVLWVAENTIDNADIAKRAKAWVVDKIDYSKQQARKDATQKREYILQQLEEKKQQLEAINMYKMLAEVDPEAKKLVEELKALGI